MKKLIFCSCWFLFLLFSSSSWTMADDTKDSSSTANKYNLVSIAYSRSSNDYFGDGTANIKPDGYRISYARQLSKQWIVEINYGKERATGRWLIKERVLGDLFDSAKTKSTAVGFSALWQADDYGISMSYSQGDSSEQSELFLPHLEETLTSDQKSASISYDRTFEFGDVLASNHWSADWSVGFQYAKFKIAISDTFFIDPPITVDSRIKQTSSSAFTDLTLSYWVEESSFAWSPYVSLSWSWEFSSKGDQLTLVSRGDRIIVLDEPGTRFSNSVRTPDSGRADLGIDFLWANGFSTSFGYSRDLATKFDSENIYVDISVAF